MPVAIVIEPAVMPLNIGTVNVKVNSSVISTILSTITGTLTLLVELPPVNVAVSGVVLKSSPPVSQTFFTQHIIIHKLHYYLQLTLVNVLME